ncbi:hypothetical protein CHS0354_027691 [Potamilus streckersoni]|uniref:Uncharacterized protein n=1 Tax=Potamilus streckersoni TaxID=2493646 RepID=A0AAE0T0M5_9BIVA|nr:hypothetical protein CHS0354_027691 [Potamilus streckersoni]
MDMTERNLCQICLLTVLISMIIQVQASTGWLRNMSKPPGTACTFNPCKINNFCGDGRVCHLNKDTCVHSCVCTDRVTHEMCQTDDAENTTATSLDDTSSVAHNRTSDSEVDDTTSFKKCFLPCQHGKCIFLNGGSASKCSCDPGWAGHLCDNEVHCTLRCPENQNCRILEDLQEVCENILYSEGILSITNRSDKCLEKYTIRPLSERKCSSGITCLYGKCQEVACKCEPGASGTLCDKSCCLDCGLHGNCSIDPVNDKTFCSCEKPYIGKLCQDLQTLDREQKVKWHLWLIGVCAVLLLILVMLAVIIPYLMWKQGVIPIMKSVYYFQPYEDDDELQWDVFVSYDSNEQDEQFVRHTLYPQLEQEMAFRVKINHFDTEESKSIINNNLSSLQNSRRTIMVISKQYVLGEFTKVRNIYAQREILKHKHRVIPIFMENISNIRPLMDRDLKTILNSGPCLQWPKEGTPQEARKFWERLQLSMPKLKKTTFSIPPNSN